MGWENVETPRVVMVYLDVHREALLRAMHNELDGQIGRAEDPDISDEVRATAEADTALLEKLIAALEGEHDLSVDAMLARYGERRLTPEEFEKHLGHLPTDGEG